MVLVFNCHLICLAFKYLNREGFFFPEEAAGEETGGLCLKVRGKGGFSCYLFAPANGSCQSSRFSFYQWTRAHDRNGNALSETGEASFQTGPF